MVTETTNHALAALRTALAIRAPMPTPEFRQKAWQVFEQALDRHLARYGTTARVTQRLH